MNSIYPSPASRPGASVVRPSIAARREPSAPGCVPARSPGLGQPGRPRLWLARAGGGDALPKPWPFSGLRILLVDDSRETLESFSVLLRLEGAQVWTAPGGAEAMARAEAQDFDLVLSDLGMPGMDGYALIRALRECPRTREVPAFALSGFSEREGIERALAGGFQAYLPKPVTLEALREAMRRTWRGGPRNGMET